MRQARWSGFVCSLLMLALLAPGYSQAATQAQIDAARIKALAWMFQNQNADGSWSDIEGARMYATGNAIHVLTGLNLKGFSFAKAVAWMGNTDAVSTDSLISKIRSLAYNSLSYEKEKQQWLAQRSVDASWGAYPKYQLAPTDTGKSITMALEMSYQNEDASFFDDLRTTVYCDLIPARLASSGWSERLFDGVSARSSSRQASIMASSQVLISFAYLYFQQGWDSNSCVRDSQTRSLLTSFNNGAGWLLGQQKADGGFGLGASSTVVESAQAYSLFRLVLASNHAANVNVINYFVNSQNATGSWNNNAADTSAVLVALGAPATALVDTDKDGIPDAVESILGTNPSVPDRDFLTN